MDTLDHDMSLRESEEGHSGMFYHFISSDSADMTDIGRGSDDASQNSDSEGQESAIS